MKKYCYKIILAILIISFTISLPLTTLAIEGTMGYQGGISIENKTEKDQYQYSEMCFLTGTPILLTGDLTIKKTDKSGVITATYTYRLSNPDYNTTLNRVVIYETVRETLPNGQITETTTLSRQPTEVITINGTTYRLIDGHFSRSVLTDPKPGINYHAGEFGDRKVYSVGTVALNNPNTITVDMSGRLYAYDQYWSSTQTQKINVLIEADLMGEEGRTKWGGQAEITVSSASRNKFQYSENEPYHISFDGGYVKSSWDESTLFYTARLPEFTNDGKPTDVLKTYSNIQSLNSPVVTERLMVPDLKHIAGFWDEEPISILYGLEVIPGFGTDFQIGKNVTRAEFVTMLMNALKDIPEDPNVRTALVNRRPQRNNTPEISPFNDVDIDHPYYESIKKAYQKGITRGSGAGRFSPNSYVTKAEAIVMIVSGLGLENLAPYPYTSTPFADNDLIPVYARNAAYVASILGIVRPDETGRFNPHTTLTHEYTAKLLYDLISYMGDDLIKDYRDRIMEF
ncbi:MAG: S-layer homology domain-containing protein [Clostridiaceae bacterium]|nr:S-layer homology domain-containing protein [Clostridiaceae bacterium]